MSLTSIKKKLSKHNQILKERFSVKALYLFGSRASGKASRRSDVDLLVEFTTEVGLFTFVQLKNFLEQNLDAKVDLVTHDALLGWMQDSIEKEKIRVA